MTEVWTFGETMVSLRAASVLAPGTSWTTHVAGAESNVAIGLARLGHSVTWRSRLGDDAFGELVARELRAEGVVVDCDVDAVLPTGFMFLQTGSYSTEARYHRAGSAAAQLDSGVEDSLIAAAPRVVVVSGITPALGAGPAAATTAAVNSARGAGAVVVLDINFRARLWSRDDATRFLEGVIPGVDVVIGSPEELTLVAESPEGVLELGPTQVVAKLGADGARLYTSDGILDGPATPAVVEDPVGAGDAFTAGYVSSLLDGLPPAERLRRANLMGSAAVRHRGDYEGLPRRRELLALEASGEVDVLR